MRSFKFILLCFLLSFTARAQFKVLPLNHGSSIHNLRTKSSDPISLPFFDDFAGDLTFPDTSIWENSQDVTIRSGIAIDPPTQQVAVLDGTRGNGTFYNSVPTSNGPTDILISKPIDLSLSDPGTVVLSFFYQLGGLGDKPEGESDSLIVQFYDSVDSTWSTFSKLEGALINETDQFFPESILVPTSYFSESFQFRFQAHGKQSGSFDSWLIDYVYLDEGRSLSALDLPDHSLTNTPSSIFRNYGQVRDKSFFEDPDAYLGELNFGLNHFFADPDFSSQSISFNIEIRDTLSNQILFEEDGVQVIDYRQIENIAIPLNDMIDDLQGIDTTIVLETKIFLDSISSQFNPPYLSKNDTLKIYNTIGRVMAYDDGSSEFAFGANLSGTSVAMAYYVAQPDLIQSLSINFTRIGRPVAGANMRITVWKDLERSESSVINAITVAANPASIIDGFQTYPLFAAVSDTFYVGYTQLTDGFVPVGLDENNDHGDKVWISTGTGFFRAEDLTGSLMMRVTFSDETITSSEKSLRQTFNIYPNPTSDWFRVADEYQEIRLYNLEGKLQPIKFSEDKILLHHLPEGLYIVTIKHEGIVETKKLVIRR